MFSNEERCRYQRNALTEVICQLRFPEILTIGANAPVDFQEAIRDAFPQYSARKETPLPKLSGMPGNLQLEKQPAGMNYQFISADGIWRVNLTSRFISLSCCRYSSWEEFAQRLDLPLAAFIRIYKPAYFERIGLRYVNALSRKALQLDGVAFRELIAPGYLGILNEEDLPESSALRSTVNAELRLASGCMAKIHAGPGIIKRNAKPDPEVKFILDLDLYMAGKLALNLSAGALHTLHSQAFSLFRGAITDTLHEAMMPSIY